MRKILQELLPRQFQQAGYHQPHFKQRASPFVFMDVDHSSVNVHTASLGRKGGEKELDGGRKSGHVLKDNTRL